MLGHFPKDKIVYSTHDVILAANTTQKILQQLKDALEKQINRKV